jgi:hypothetical protein
MERRIEKRREWAESAARKSSSAFERSHSLTAQIPFGQPVQLGHHSQRAHENTLARSDALMSRACAESHKSADHEQKANNAERMLDKIVFSDDEDAVERIEARIAGHDKQATLMTAINKAWKKATGTPAERSAKLVASGVCSERIAEQAALTMTQFTYLKAPLDTTNIRARIRTDKKRLEDIRAQQARAERAEKAGGICIEGEDVVCITFSEKPEYEILEALRSAGFQWGGGSWCGWRTKIPAEVHEAILLLVNNEILEGKTP